MSDQEVPASDLPDSLNEVPPEDMPEGTSNAVSGQEVPSSDLPDEQNPYASAGQQALTIGENFAKGVAPGVAQYAENKLSDIGVPSLSPQAQQARQQTNPNEAEISKLGGNVALFAALPETELLGSAGWLSKIGSSALDQGLKMAAIQGGNEIGSGDPADTVASHMIKAGGIGLVGGTLFGGSQAGAAKLLEKTNLGNKLTSAIIGMGHGLAYPGEKAVSLSESLIPEAERSGIDNGAFKMGQKLASVGQGKIASTIGKVSGSIVGGLAGHSLGGETGTIIGSSTGPLIESLIEPYIGKATSKVVGPAILKMASKGNFDGLEDLVNYGTCVAKGDSMLSKGIEGLFSSGSNDVINQSSSEKDREKLKDYVKDGDLGQQIQNSSTQENQGFAHGGEVKDVGSLQLSNGIAEHMPEHNVLLNTAKGRVNNYLNSVRPLPPVNKLPFDKEYPDPQKENKYNKVIDMANNPISILKNIKEGSLIPEQVKHFTQMYPEIHSAMSKKMTEHITKHQMDETKKPPYKVRQAMSLFMGANLDSSLTPQNMMAAQATFIPQGPQPQAKNSKADLSKMGENAMTPSQSREQRQNKN